MRERGERIEQMRVENRALNGNAFNEKVRLQNVPKMAYIALQPGENTKLS